MSTAASSRTEPARADAGATVAPATPAVALRRLSLHYTLAGGARVDVLRDIDLEIAAGQAVAVVGPSGSGKTSLLLLAGLVAEPGRRRAHAVGAHAPVTGSAAARRRLTPASTTRRRFRL
ncbi:MAG: ATP-binding cassette domain-containing protein [Rubrivivax sp.]|nr:ATP-binding cassette domain-containing protein [Rubrivivax sp.]